MASYKYVNGELVQLSSTEETARDNEVSASIAEKNATEYSRERKVGTATTSGYDAVTNQLDQLYHDIKDGKFGADAKTGEWYVGITSVKTAFPKPS
tara:strand:- start:58 stop:345 length:288 start_codon:yes stop_codon:yes gene_type:complete